MLNKSTNQVCRLLDMNLVKLHTTAEQFGDHDPQEQKLNFLISSFTGELFNFTLWQNDHVGNKDRV